MPVASQQLARRTARTDTGEQFVLLSSQHG